MTTSRNITITVDLETLAALAGAPDGTDPSTFTAAIVRATAEDLRVLARAADLNDGSALSREAIVDALLRLASKLDAADATAAKIAEAARPAVVASIKTALRERAK